MISRLYFVRQFIVFFSLWLLATATQAQTTIPVGPSQTYTTIQSGINAANTGDTVLVAPGTYYENIDFKGKAITVTSSGGAASTIIDGNSAGPAVTFKSGETSASTISGFTIQHGGEFGWVSAYSRYGIGNVYINNSSPSILNNTITLSNCWGIYSNYSAPLIQNNIISATQDPNGDCSFGGGAAIIVWGGINGKYNSSSVNSGRVLGNTIENNVESGLEDAGGNGGAGIAVWGGTLLIENNIIRNNSSPGGSGGAINFVYGQGTVIAQNLIYGNSAGCGGGAIATDGQGLYIINNTIADNIGVDKSGYSECASISQIYPNPDMYGSDKPSDIFINNIISGSTSYPAVDCSWFNTPSEAIQPTFENNILYNAGGLFFGSYCVDVSGKYNNIAADPQFANSSAHDYHLQSTSPAIDSGLNSALQTFTTLTGLTLSQDFGGNQRMQDGSGKGCIVDTGAYEYPNTTNNCGVSETLTSSLNPSMAGQSVTFTAELSSSTGIPTGSVQFLDGSTLLSTQTVSSTGVARFSTSTLTVGSHTITASYQPTGSFGASTVSVIQVVNSDTTSTSLTCLPAPIDIYNTAQLTATVASSFGTPTGYIAFSDNGTSLATQALVSGSTSLIYTGSVAETHIITATYTPTGNFATSTATCSEIVNALPTTSTLTVSPATSNYGSQVKLSVTVSPTTLPGPSLPTGVVTFYNGASAIGTGTLTGGVATFTTSSLPIGSYSITCMYSGSSIYATSNCNAIPVTINADTTALSLSASTNPATYLSPVTFTTRLTINGQPATAGNIINLNINGQSVVLATDATGTATYATNALPVGSDPVTANFAATNTLLASSASLTEVITATSSSVSLTGTPNPGDFNQTVTLTATVSSPATSTVVSSGTVTFYDGRTSLGTAQLTATGTASITPRFTTAGDHPIQAIYNGTVDFSASTSATLDEKINVGDFSIGVMPGAVNMYTGQAGTVQISIASLQGFNQPLTLSCSDLPANATCTFTPATLPQGQGSTNLLIQTSAPHEASAGYATGPAALLGAVALLLLPGKKRRRGILRGLTLMLLVVAIGTGITGCGALHSITSGTPPGTYQVTVTATTTGSGTVITHSAVVTLTAKSLF
jgi:hypothetical protein